MTEPAVATKNVLVVEDEEIISLFIRNELEDAGFAVELVTTAKEARAKIQERRSRFEAAVIDLRLPDELGDSLVRETPQATAGVANSRRNRSDQR